MAGCGPRLSARGPQSCHPHCQPEAGASPEGSGAGVTPPVPRDLWSPQKASWRPPASQGDPAPRPPLWTAPGSNRAGPPTDGLPVCASAPGWPRDWRPTPGRGTGRPGASSEQSTPPVHLTTGSSTDADKLFWQNADPESLKPTSSRATGNTAGQCPGPGAGREEPWGPGIPTPGPTGLAFRWKPRTARTPHRWEAALWSGQPRAENRGPAASPGGCMAPRPPPGLAHTRAPSPRAGPSHLALSRSPPSDPSSDPTADSGLGVTAQGPFPCSLGQAPLFSRLGLDRSMTHHRVGTPFSAGSTQPSGSAEGTARAGDPQRRASRGTRVLGLSRGDHRAAGPALIPALTLPG